MGENLPAGWVATLQSYVSQLRKAMGPEAIQTRPPGYLLSVLPEAIDAVRFERLLGEGRAALVGGDPARAAEALAVALALWRGPAFGELATEAFARTAAARLEDARLSATEEQVDAELALGHHAEVAGRLVALCDAHPLRERLWGQLVVALYRSGRQPRRCDAAGGCGDA